MGLARDIVMSDTFFQDTVAKDFKPNPNGISDLLGNKLA